MKKKKALSKGIMFPIFAISIIFLMSCAVKAPEPLLYPENPPPPAYKFEYTPVKEVSSLTATIALISPKYSFTPPTSSKDIMGISNDYLNNLKSDFEETLIAKGYSISGPYDNFEKMTYPDKEKAILALIPTVTIKYRSEHDPNTILFSQSLDTKLIERMRSDGETRYYRRNEEIFEINGQVTVEGRIELVLYEPITMNKMWVKQIVVPNEVQPYKHYKYKTTYVNKNIFTGKIMDTQPGIERMMKSGDSRPNALAKALESAYVSQLKQFSDYFHPREIAQLIKSAEKLRKK